jgi:excisionase family DNA binding protein
MNTVSTQKLSEMAGITKRHCQRLLVAGDVPDAVRTSGGHWLIPDNAEVKSWADNIKRQSLKSTNKKETDYNMNKSNKIESAQIERRWISINEASKYLGVSVQTIRNWSKAGEIALHNVSLMGARGRVFLDKYKLDDLIERHVNASPSVLVMNQKRSAK